MKGFGVIEDLSFYIQEFSPANIFLLHGVKSFERSGAKDILSEFFKKLNVKYWSNFENNPCYFDMLRGLEIVKQEKIDLIIAVGGGSVVDMGKLLSVFANNDESLRQLDKDINSIAFSNNEIPVFAIPTTAGTGSETTQFAVLWKDGQKISIDNEKLLPKRIILEPKFLENQSPKSYAPPLMDALAQGIESYWNVNSTEESKRYAKKAISLITETLLDNKKDIFSKRALGAFYAGKAINITRTTAAHSVSYSFTAYKRVPHGHAVMLTLPLFLKYNSEVNENDCLDRRGVEHVRNTIDEIVKMLNCDSVDEAVKKLQGFMDLLGLERKLEKLGFKNKKQDIRFIIENGFNPQRVKNNPRHLTKEALEKILERIF